MTLEACSRMGFRGILPKKSACYDNQKETRPGSISKGIRYFLFDISPIWVRHITPPPFWTSYLSMSTHFHLVLGLTYNNVQLVDVNVATMLAQK